MKEKVNKNILNVTPYQPGKPIDEVRRELGLEDVIKLASNENPYPPSPKVIAAISEAALEVNRYPDSGCFYLRRELAKHLNVSEGHLIFGNGTDEVIVMVIRAFIEQGDEIVIAQPTFMVYSIAGNIVGAKIKTVPLIDFDYDLEGMAKAVTDKTKIVFIANPDNPAGTYVNKDQLRKFLDTIRKDIVVFMDEAYYEFVYENDYPDSLALQKEYPNLFVSRTFSKSYGLAGLRVGYGIATKEIIDLINQVREPFNVNSIAQVAALACLKDQEYYDDILKKNEEQRQFLYKSLEETGLSCRKTYTNFILVDVADKKDIAQLLLEKGIIIRRMKAWGLDQYIRITIGTPEENKRCVKTIKDILEI